jgi:hypothetical protein
MSGEAWVRLQSLTTATKGPNVGDKGPGSKGGGKKPKTSTKKKGAATK